MCWSVDDTPMKSVSGPKNLNTIISYTADYLPGMRQIMNISKPLIMVTIFLGII